MRFAAVASDYDGTLATEGRVQPATAEMLERLIASGRKLILVTGRILEELLPLFPQAALCSRIVAENGAVLYRPDSGERRALGPPAPPALIGALRRRGITPLQIGKSIIATVRPHEVPVLETIRDLGLEHHVVFNRESVMVLPPAVNKATGLLAALRDLQLSPHNVVAIGDSENDHALFEESELRVAVGNAVPMLREAADVVTDRGNGGGTAQALSWVIDGELEQRMERLPRHQIALGAAADGSTVGLAPTAENLLIAGSSASGKSTLAHAVLEQLTERGYQVCVIDPEGDYESFGNAIVFGNAERGPTLTEVMTALDTPDSQIVVNLVGLPLRERPLFLFELLPHIQTRRAKLGRPHRILLDETHHLLPTSSRPALEFGGRLSGMIFVTVHPDQVSSPVLDMVDIVVALGADPVGTLRSFARGADLPAPVSESVDLHPGEAVTWRAGGNSLVKILTVSPAADRRRHRRKYAEGELPPHRSFFFRGPGETLNLRAQNLIVFRQLADGVDDATWLYHLRKHDYSSWMEQEIKDPLLARLVREIEAEPDADPSESRRRIARAIEQWYTLPMVGS